MIGRAKGSSQQAAGRVNDRPNQRKMKTYRISRWTFIIVTILILALPVSRKWRFFLNGKRTTGVVSVYGPVAREQRNGTVILDDASEIYFFAGDSTCLTLGPSNMEYKPGRTVTIFYDPDNPAENCIFTFSALYLAEYSALPLILLIVWGAFYLSFNSYSRFARNKGKGTPIDAPRLTSHRRSLRQLLSRLWPFR
jgi:hypothetical protein